MIEISGESIMRGIAWGTLRIRHRNERPLPEADPEHHDVQAELKKFESARQRLREAQQKLYEKTRAEAGEKSAEVFLAHMQMLDDEMLKQSVTEIIREQNRDAAYAVQVGLSAIVGRFQAMDDLYVRTRSEDIADLADGLLGELTGMATLGFEEEKPYILAAEQLSPSELMMLDRSKLAGLVLSGGSGISHTAILAKGMEMPMLVKCGSFPEEWDGKEAVLDGYQGCLFLEPSKEQQESFLRKQEKEKEDRQRLQELKGKESVTADGKPIRLLANIKDPTDVGAVIANDAEGVGLFRTEFLYLNGNDYPTEEEQFFVYRQVLKTLSPKPVVIRTCDIGADKAAEYMKLSAEDNPALGLRGVRFSLKEKQVFRTQLRAMLRASAFGSLRIMIPMITDPEEVRECRKLLDECEEELKKEGVQIGEYLFGLMIETPAAVLCADELAELSDFFSIGSNDLAQYTLAVDRQDTALAVLFNPAHPSVLKGIELTVQAGHRHGIPVGICGELGGNPEFTEKFLRMGIDAISADPKSILALREKVRGYSQSPHSDNK